ncbi:MAG: tRNA pseudouridine(38-40) synthase TruA [Candidatus Omnitrophota bacterium]|jgi:tRNA pseudouridine38-40 synthase
MKNGYAASSRNIKLTIQYDGTHYAGWQFQKNGRSIQEAIQDAIKKITGKKAKLIGSGRTDAGVHAEAQVANFKTRSRIPLKNLQMAINSALPDDIVISKIEEVASRFNAQHDAKSKLYRYTVVNNDFVSPMLRRYAAKCFYKIDIDLMKRAAKLLVGRHDFTSFRTIDGEEKNAIRTIRRIKIEKLKDVICIDIEANGFLYNMVRTIVGTLIEVGRGKFTVGRVREILKKRDRKCSGPTMPAKGLCLVKVFY